ncbi:YgjP-like metallopeptidase domain-containing protein, partial [Propylenella binzhouense]
MRIAWKRGPESLAVSIGGSPVPVAVRRSERARRLVLRLDARKGTPVLTLPKRVPLAEGQRFLDRHAGWLAARLADAPGASAFADGSAFPLRGEACRIVHRGGRGLMRLAPGPGGTELHVPGERAHLPRR